jgi:deoxyribonuclease V
VAARIYKQFHLPPSLLFPDGWSGIVPDLRDIQTALAAKVRLTGGLRRLPRWIAGVDVGAGRFARSIRAAAVLIDSRNLAPVAQATVEQPAALPYIPGLLSFRELPAVLEVLGQLSQQPELLVCDGQGIAHPRRFGIAAHLGVATGLPSIGVAKPILVGTHAPVADERGACVPLLVGDEVVGSVLRSRAGCAPLIVSPGHRVDIERAADFVMSLVTRYRLPEPTRLADRLSKTVRRP